MTERKDFSREKHAPTEKGTPRVFLDNGIALFAQRLREAIGDESIRAFARRCGLSDAVLHVYLRGETMPTLDRLDQIAGAAGRPPGWFIGAVGSPGPATALDARVLRLALEIVENAASLLGLPGSTSARAELVSRVYVLLANAEDATAALPAALQLVRTELAPTAPAAQPAQSPAEPPAAEAPTLHKWAPLV